ncbi:MAG: cytochrome [Cellvibrionaceae bacterium]|nr:cytochrome [Cellvibrionaceae bacterium]|tara:strand:+ start:54748 stop:55965 length:1218 start_codon:yes stop_codon:yes gene_type:complete
MLAGIPLAGRPSHVPAELERDFNIYNVNTLNEDWQLKLKELVHGEGIPDVFWTPHNSGHWVAGRAAIAKEVLSNAEHFSSRSIVVIPEMNPNPPFAPLQIDPPDHAAYRAILAPAMTPKAVQALGERAREMAIELIEGFKAKGECEFVGDFATWLPIAIFMQMVDLPLEDRPMLLGIADSLVRATSPEEQMDGHIRLHQYSMQKIQERRANPGNDMITTLTKATIKGEPVPDETSLGMLNLLLTAGLDTVANMMGFFALFLANNPEYRQRLIDDPKSITPAIEELLRRHPIANLAREVKVDCELGGAHLKKGERILVPAIAYGLDERQFDNPEHVDFDRANKIHEAFGDGVHRCMGSMLARVELRVFLEEWLKRIPNFTVKKGADIQVTSASVAGIRELYLVWDT